MIVRLSRGFEVDREALAVGLIEKVGIGGSYLAGRSTLKAAREAFLPMLWDGDPFDVWAQKGKKDPMTVAREKTAWILANHAPNPLPRRTARELKSIVETATKS